MKPPLNVEIHEHLTSTWWIEEDGILYSVSKKNAPEITRQQSLEQLEDLKKITGGKKMCMLLDITYGRSAKKEDREFIAEELAKVIKAVALVSNSALGKMVANLFFNLKPPPYPTKMFNNEQEARTWLRQYLYNIMEMTGDDELAERIEQILKLNLKLVKPDVPVQGRIAEDKNKLDIILNGLENVAEEMESKSFYIEERSRRLNDVLDVLLEYTLMNFSRQISISEKGDELDAVALGLNTLGEELESHINQLKDKTEDLLRSNKQLEQFVYIASHDLQEPLKTLSNYVGLFQDDYKEKLDKNSSRVLDIINTATDRMRALIKDLLEYARIGQEPNVIVVNCNFLLLEILGDMASSIQDSKAKIELELLPVVNGNYLELKSLFQNLISNAIKFKKSEGPLIIHIKAKENQAEWVFSIRDNGIGIEPKYHERIFSIFQKLHSRKQYAGTGIGLAHCKKVVEEHRGKIWVESELDKGSTFYFTIPKVNDK